MKINELKNKIRRNLSAQKAEESIREDLNREWKNTLQWAEHNQELAVKKTELAYRCWRISSALKAIDSANYHAKLSSNNFEEVSKLNKEIEASWNVTRKLEAELKELLK